MKKHIPTIAIFGLLIFLAVGVNSCIKTKSDALDPILGDYTGVLIDSSLVTNQNTSFSSFVVTIGKLTSSRISISSTVPQMEPFYADVITSSTGFYFNIPGQSVSDKNTQGADLAAYHFPSGYTGVFVTATHTLTFASRVDNTTTGQGVISSYTGTKQ
ncbi:MAG: hypothetical protein JWO03_2304 [Bacteroidetes bacterium]|nr:hypothetical protein [Bacteroidota bacterium]